MYIPQNWYAAMQLDTDTSAFCLTRFEGRAYRPFVARPRQDGPSFGKARFGGGHPPHWVPVFLFGIIDVGLFLIVRFKGYRDRLKLAPFLTNPRQSYVWKLEVYGQGWESPQFDGLLLIPGSLPSQPVQFDNGFSSVVRKSFADSRLPSRISWSDL
jgi:hypothetical protein